MFYRVHSLLVSIPVFVCALAIVLVLGACDSGTSIGDHNDTDLNSNRGSDHLSVSQFEVDNYVYGRYENGSLHQVRVTLDPNMLQEQLSFDNFDEYFTTLDELMEVDELTINASLYQRLIHTLYPAEIKLLDSDGSVIIGDSVYTSTEEASYRRELGAPLDSWELEEYWGKDGDAVEKELATYHRYYDEPELLDPLSFHNPQIKFDVENLKNGDLFKAPPSTAKYVTREELTGYSVCLPTPRSGEAGIPTQCYQVKFLLWNQSTTTKKRRAHAGIDTFIKIPGGSWESSDRGPLGFGTRIRLSVTAIGGHSERTASCYGDLQVGDLNLSVNPPYTFIRSGQSCSSITVMANRKAGRGARSENSVGFEDYFTPVVLSNGRKYLVYSNRGWWEESNYFVY